MTDSLLSGVPIEPQRDSAANMPDGPPPEGFGARLAWERQRSGLSVSDIAATLRLNPKQVRALEQEDLSRLPAPVYVRGFVRSYARLVGVDAAPLLTDLNAKLAPQDAPVSVIDSMLAASNQLPARTSGMSRQLVIGLSLLVLIVLGLLGWQSTRTPEPETVATTPAAPAVAAPPATIEAVSTATSEAPAPTVEPQEVFAEQVPVALEPATPAPVTPAPVTPAPVTTAPVTTASVALAPRPALLIRFSGPSWVEVTDAGGKVVLSGLSLAGAEHAVDGKLPLTVLVGNANNAAVEVRGEVLNLQPLMRNNVARFTVK